MSGYTKLFSSIIASTIWREDNDTRIVWITMLAMADRYGVVEASVPGLADMARVTVDGARRSILKLSSPDPDSRSHEYDGRRIEEVEGGWRILNHGRYREKLSEDDRREYQRKWQANRRAKEREADGVDSGREVSTNVDTVDISRGRVQKQSTEAEAEARGEEEDFHPSHLVALWNDHTTPPLPKCIKLTKARIIHAKQRLVEHGLDWWLSVIKRIDASTFCHGGNDRGWLATFDWLIANEDNAVKVLEGKYDDRIKPHPAGLSRTAGNAEAARQWLESRRGT